MSLHKDRLQNHICPTWRKQRLEKKNRGQNRAFLRKREFPIAVFPTSVTTERGRYSASSLTGEIRYRIIFFWLEENRGQQKFLQNSHERAERMREFPKNLLFFLSQSTMSQMMISALFTEKTAPGRIPGEKCSTIDVVDAADETDAQRRPQRKKRVPGIQNFVAGW